MAAPYLALSLRVRYAGSIFSDLTPSLHQYVSITWPQTGNLTRAQHLVNFKKYNTMHRLMIRKFWSTKFPSELIKFRLQMDMVKRQTRSILRVMLTQTAKQPQSKMLFTPVARFIHGRRPRIAAHTSRGGDRIPGSGVLLRLIVLRVTPWSWGTFLLFLNWENPIAVLLLR